MEAHVLHNNEEIGWRERVYITNTLENTVECS